MPAPTCPPAPPPPLHPPAPRGAHPPLCRCRCPCSTHCSYEAERLADGQRYALKLTDCNALGPADREAVVEEVRLLASLHHPSLLHYYEAFYDHDCLCVVTELVMGGDLAALLRCARRRRCVLHAARFWRGGLAVGCGLAQGWLAQGCRRLPPAACCWL